MIIIITFIVPTLRLLCSFPLLQKFSEVCHQAKCKKSEASLVPRAARCTRWASPGASLAESGVEEGKLFQPPLSPLALFPCDLTTLCSLSQDSRRGRGSEKKPKHPLLAAATPGTAKFMEVTQSYKKVPKTEGRFMLLLWHIAAAV